MFDKKITIYSIIFLMFLSATLAAQNDHNQYELKQVMIFGRHNVRAPLTDSGILQKITRYEWPKWDVKGGWLTTKGGILEAYLGDYTRSWLNEHGMLKDSCPNSQEFYAYANSLQRTVATAQYFVVGAFPGCDIQVHHQDEMGKMDPVFDLKVSADFIDSHPHIEKEMRKKANKLELKRAFKLLDKIADYKNPVNHTEQGDNSLTNNKNKFTVTSGKPPSLNGPLRIGTSLVDAFNMQYYEGFPDKDVAWGGIENRKERNRLLGIVNSYEKILFTTGGIAKDIASPLLSYINKHFTNDKISEENPRVTIMIGHDSNIATLLKALNFESHSLPNQDESIPIGGQIVFQRWHDTTNNEDFLKVEYVYQTTEQIRQAIPLSKENPPRRVKLEMKGCINNDEGYCKWGEFEKLLNESLN